MGAKSGLLSLKELSILVGLMAFGTPIRVSSPDAEATKFELVREMPRERIEE